jgi:hypothetical protein
MLLWMDGFGTYGQTIAQMTAGPWAQVSAANLVTNPARTGTYALQVGTHARRVFGADRNVIGFGMALYMNALPGANARIVEFSDNGNNNQCWVILLTTGVITLNSSDAVTGAVVVLGQTAGPVLTAGSWQHIEMKVTCDTVNGGIELRVNGVTVLQVSGVNTRGKFSATSLMSQLDIATSGSGWFIDDVFAWDTTGTVNKDFLGDRRVITLLPNNTTAKNDWVPSAGQSYAAIKEVPADDDATYVAASAVGNRSEFAMDDTPAGVTAIAAIQVQGRFKKTDSGAANVKQSIVSGASVSAGADRPALTAYTAFVDVFELDPATGALWTKAAVDAALVRVDRTV